jgi:capsular exopolysaccharide synthesis family protein
LQSQAAAAAAAPEDTARIIQRARPDAQQVSPRPTRDAIIAFALALVLGAAVILVANATRDRYATALDAALDLHLPILVEIPKGGRKDHVVSESFKTLRERLLAQLDAFADAGGAAIMVTGSEIGCGKTFTSSNLARSLAAGSSSVLLIDGDLRRPRIHDEFDLKAEPGLATWLRLPASDESNVMASRVDLNGSRELEVVTAGAPGDDAAEILGSARMAELVQRAREQFDVLVVDSPPVGAIADALVLARLSSAVLFVVDSHRTRRRHARRALDTLRAIDANVVGLVFNRSAAPVTREAAYYSVRAS